jgi:thioredoxin 1
MLLRRIQSSSSSSSSSSSLIRFLSTAKQSNYIVPVDSASLAVVETGANKKIYYFTATWCPPCRFIGPKFEAVAAKYPSLSFVKIDIDQFESAAVKYGIRSVPTFIFANGAKVMSQFSGADESQLLKSADSLEKS